MDALLSLVAALHGRLTPIPLEALVALAIGTLTGGGVYLALRARTFPLVMGLTLLSYAVNIFLFATGRLTIGQPPVIDAAASGYADPLPQALVLTAIVISFAMTAFLIMLSLRARAELGNDHVDGQDGAPDRPPSAPDDGAGSGASDRSPREERP